MSTRRTTAPKRKLVRAGKRRAKTLPPRPSGRDDGRSLRRERNRQLIVDAYCDLVRAGVIEPTADDVAARAGLGRRTVFRQFEDMEGLARSVNERVTSEVSALVGPLVPSGNLEADIHTLVERRSLVFAHIAPFRRAGAIVRHRFEFLRVQNTIFTAMLRARVEAAIAPHLPAGSDHIVEAIDLILSFEAWERLTQDQQLGQERAAEVMWRAAVRIATSG